MLRLWKRVSQRFVSSCQFDKLTCEGMEVTRTLSTVFLKDRIPQGQFTYSASVRELLWLAHTMLEYKYFVLGDDSE